MFSLLSLLAGSGIGQAYSLYPLTRLAVITLYFAFVVRTVKTEQLVRRRDLILFFGLLGIVCIWPMLQGYSFEGIEYGFLMLVPYVLGQAKLRQKHIRMLGLACGGVGLAVLVSRLYLGIFANWNANDMAIAGFFGSAVMSAAPWVTRKQKFMHRCYLLLVSYLVYQMDSRSCLIGMILLMLVAFNIIDPRKFARKKGLRRLVLIVPAVIAIGVVLFQNAPVFDSLNEFSTQYFGKPIFNGRNTAWEDGVQRILKNPLFGDGHIINGYWHNCAMSALTSFGIVGYIFWLGYFENILLDAQRWCFDHCLCCCVTSFLIIVFQQSFELGLISTTGSMLPYVLLGIILGRVKYLKERECVA